MTRLVKHGKSWALVIEEPKLKLLGFDENTELEMFIEDDCLVVRAAKSKELLPRDNEVNETAKKIMKKYDPVFKKLAKK